MSVCVYVVHECANVHTVHAYVPACISYPHTHRPFYSSTGMYACIHTHTHTHVCLHVLMGSPEDVLLPLRIRRQRQALTKFSIAFYRHARNCTDTCTQSDRPTAPRDRETGRWRVRGIATPCFRFCGLMRAALHARCKVGILYRRSKAAPVLRGRQGHAQNVERHSYKAVGCPAQ